MGWTGRSCAHGESSDGDGRGRAEHAQAPGGPGIAVADSAVVAVRPTPQTAAPLRYAIACFRPASMATTPARSVTLTGVTDRSGYVPSGLLLPLGPFPC